MSRLGKLMRTLIRQTTDPLHTPAGQVPHPEPFVPRGATGSPAAPPVDMSGGSIHYAPDLDGAPDPGEVVWAWVPYDEDASQGKDRPVLVIGREGGTLLALQLTSQDHDLDAEDEARYGRYWMDIGTGDWDHERRPSEVRLDRVLRIEEHTVRREGAVLDRAVFDQVIAEARTHHDF
ncbi:MAG TPA: type II toxin-antitoxin system PemK/MazF family toxin [Nocardioidaceae bacterium]|nr:type II toxin-antitoxin system PemK/MazF family toxin [Nocardioidaceae bacterium]